MNMPGKMGQGPERSPDIILWWGNRKARGRGRGGDRDGVLARR